jgi:hypothetical protein
MVGRDLLVGAAAAARSSGLWALGKQVPSWLGQPQQWSAATFIDPESLTSWTHTAFRILVNIYAAAQWSIIWLFVLVLLRILLRRNLLALLAWCAVQASQVFLASGPLTGLLMGVPFAALELLVLTRFGLLGFASYTLVAFLVTELPLTFDVSLWWAPRGFLAVAVVAAIGAYGFRTALAGRPAFGGDWLEA